MVNGLQMWWSQKTHLSWNSGENPCKCDHWNYSKSRNSWDMNQCFAHSLNRIPLLLTKSCEGKLGWNTQKLWLAFLRPSFDHILRRSHGTLQHIRGICLSLVRLRRHTFYIHRVIWSNNWKCKTKVSDKVSRVNSKDLLHWKHCLNKVVVP